jgi:hypothetical protein
LVLSCPALGGQDLETDPRKVNQDRADLGMLVPEDDPLRA